jgi:hypothetical protein
MLPAQQLASHPSHGSGAVMGGATEARWKKDHCVWDPERKSDFPRMLKRWENELRLNWQPCVIELMQGRLAQSSPDWALAANSSLRFVMAHVNCKSAEGEYMHQKIAEAQGDGTITQQTGLAVVRFIRESLVLTNEGDQQKARAALLGIVISPKMSLRHLEELYWWAEGVRIRLPAHERTAECDVLRCMVRGMKGELATRKMILEGLLDTATAAGRRLDAAATLRALDRTEKWPCHQIWLRFHEQDRSGDQLHPRRGCWFPSQVHSKGVLPNIWKGVLGDLHCYVQGRGGQMFLL